MGPYIAECVQKAKMKKIKSEIAVYQTARNSHAAALKSELTNI